MSESDSLDSPASPHPCPKLSLPYGCWHADTQVELDLPEGFRVHRIDPQDGPALDDAQIERAFEQPIGTPRISQLARGRKSAVIAVDDTTRPTPAHRLLPRLIDELVAGGIDPGAIRLLMGTAAHRPPDQEEIERKLGPEIARRFPPLLHDFMGDDIRFVGWVEGGPVHLNRHFLDADLRICVGGAIPHNETGFGGGAKMVVPGVAGRLTIAHFHGALPPRPAGVLEAEPGRCDRRAWSEAVARHVGVDAIVCTTVNASGELAAIAVGDLVEAHRTVARRAAEIGRTTISRALAERARVIVVNAYPLDSDPIQMGKSITLARKFPKACTVAINAASDGIFYHGMGMGSGVSPRRLLRNLPGWITSPVAIASWLRGLRYAVREPLLFARFCYFSLNHLSYAAFSAGEGQLALDPIDGGPSPQRASPLVWSERFPGWGFRRKYRGGRLYRSWPDLRDTLASRYPSADVLVFPCSALQLLEID